MYVKRSIEARSRNHFYHRKPINITYFSVCVCVGGGGVGEWVYWFRHVLVRV
jgi:hypothetical protein